ncbi:MAG: elongation factor P [Planctomycetota bacterium]
MIKAVDLRKGKTILYEGEPCIIHEAQHVAKGNKRSYMQVKVKKLRSGIMNDVRFSVDDRIEIPFVESKQYEFLYREGDKFIVMDLESFDQIPISPDIVGEAADWLKPNEKITCELFNGQMVSFVLPNTVELTVKDTSPVVKGATATNQSKEAILETGVKIRVPPFIEIGTRICVDTRNGEYLERAK